MKPIIFIILYQGEIFTFPPMGFKPFIIPQSFTGTLYYLKKVKF